MITTYCYEVAGWRRCGVTKWNRLLIYEKWPEDLRVREFPR